MCDCIILLPIMLSQQGTDVGNVNNLTGCLGNCQMDGWRSGTDVALVFRHYDDVIGSEHLS